MDWLLVCVILAAVAYGVTNALATAARDNVHNRKLRDDLEHREAYLSQRDEEFKKGLLPGRRWLAQLIAEAEYERDRRNEALEVKKHPAMRSAQVVAEIKAEKRTLKAELKFLQYQVRSYEEYFPFLSDYREAILDETVPLHQNQDNRDQIEQADPSVRYLSSEEWNALPSASRSQMALKRYIERSKPNWEIGRLYERYVGYLREQEGWEVNYHGALKGFEDLGRDLICQGPNHIEIVQAKCWSSAKTIHEKHVFQLYGTTLLFRLQNPNLTVHPVLAVTTQLSEVARLAAKELGVRVDRIPLRTDWPMIKCNIGTRAKERIYHLPFDQQYDRVRISPPHEKYALTAHEAEAEGFRRAWRYRGPLVAP